MSIPNRCNPNIDMPIDIGRWASGTDNITDRLIPTEQKNIQNVPKNKINKYIYLFHIT